MHSRRSIHIDTRVSPAENKRIRAAIPKEAGDLSEIIRTLLMLYIDDATLRGRIAQIRLDAMTMLATVSNNGAKS
jgi:hypothetical protein